MKRSWFILVCAFLAINGFGVWKALQLWQAHLNRDETPPRLVASPDPATKLSGRMPVQWIWDQPVVSPHQVGGEVIAPPAHFEPEVAGRFLWTNDRTLRFTPEEDWPVARRVSVKVETTLVNASQRIFAFSHSVTLSGERLQVKKSHASVDPRSRQLQVRLQVNQEVESAALKQHLSLWDEMGSRAPFQLQETPSPFEFLVTAAWVEGEEMVLRVRKGLEARFGDVGALGNDQIFHITHPDTFTFTGWEAQQPTFGSGNLRLTFSSQPDLLSLQDSLRVVPEVPFRVQAGYWWRENECVISGDFQPGTAYRFVFGEGIRGKNGSPLPESFERSIVFPHREPGLRFAHHGELLNASGARRIMLQTVNEESLKVTLHRVHSNNLVAYSVRASSDDWFSQLQPADHALGHVVWEKEMNAETGTLALDLMEALEPAGQGVYRVTVRGKTSRQQVDRLIAVSDIGLMARRHDDILLVWAVHLSTAEPVANLPVELWSHTRQSLGRAQTDVSGVAHISLPSDPALGEPQVVLAADEQRLGLLRLQAPNADSDLPDSRPYIKEGSEAFVYTPREMYRPGETVQARAIVRSKDWEVPGEFPVTWRLQTVDGEVVWTKTDVLSDVGTSVIEFSLVDSWPSGAYTLWIGLPGEEAAVWGQTTVHVESFVPPQVVVEAEVPGGDVGVPNLFEVQVNARMLYGGPAAYHKGSATLTLEPVEFRASEYESYSFSDERKTGFSSWSKKIEPFETDADGRAVFTVQVPEDKVAPSALEAWVNINVTEFSGRPATTFIRKRVDRVPWYPGIQAAVQPEGRVQVDLVAITPQGSVWETPTEVEVEWMRLVDQSGYQRDAKGRYTWVQEEVPIPEGRTRVRLEEGAGNLDLSLAVEGTYRLVMRSLETGATSSCRVALGSVLSAPPRADRVELSVDREVVHSGETVELSVHAPFAGQVLLTVEDDQLLKTVQLPLKEKKQVFSIQMPDSQAANVWIRVTVVRPQPGKGEQPVLRSEGALAVRYRRDALEEALTLEVPEQLRPADSVILTLTGTPGAEVVVSGVDEGLLFLTDARMPDPVAWFTVLRSLASVGWDMFDDLLPEMGPGHLEGGVRMGGGFSSALRQRLNPVDAKRFKPLTWWSGKQRIPQSGELVLEAALPEFTGAVRWTAVQVSEQGLGSVEARSRVGRPVVVQQSLPLFLAPKDETRWSVRVHNRSDAPQAVVLQPQLDGALEGSLSKVEMELAPDEVRFHHWTLAAAERIGVGGCTLTLRQNEEVWLERLELAVRPPQSFQVSHRSVVLEPGEKMSLKPVEGFLHSTVERSFEVSGLPFLQAQAAVDALLHYPYGCVEQTVSTAMPALLMPDSHPELKAGAGEMVQIALQKLNQMQRKDGSFGYWGADDRTSVPGTFEALTFLQLAEEAGYAVHGPTLTAGVDWVSRWLSREQFDVQPGLHNLQIASACRVLARAGLLQEGWIQWLRERAKFSDARTRIQMAEAIYLAGYSPLARTMLEGLAPLPPQDSTAWLWYDDVAGNAQLMRLLIEIAPRDPRIPVLCQKLIDARSDKGVWRSTYSNAAAARALHAYAQMFSGSSDVWNVQAVLYGTAQPVPRDDRLVVEMDKTGWIENLGEQRVYVQERISGVPSKTIESNSVFDVERALIRLDGTEVNPLDVRTGEILLLRFRVSGVPQPSEYFAVNQLLPAGLEPLSVAQQRSAVKRMHAKPAEIIAEPRHIEVRDDRFLIFPNRIGVEPVTFLVLVQAVTPGTYTFPAVLIQDMYAPELHATGKSSMLKVLP